MSIVKFMDITRLSLGKRTMQDSIDRWCSKFGSNPEISAKSFGFFCIVGESP